MTWKLNNDDFSDEIIGNSGFGSSGGVGIAADFS